MQVFKQDVAPQCLDLVELITKYLEKTKAIVVSSNFYWGDGNENNVPLTLKPFTAKGMTLTHLFTVSSNDEA